MKANRGIAVRICTNSLIRLVALLKSEVNE